MKCLFVHDHKFLRADAHFFSNGAFSSAVWSRYTSILDNLTVVGRDGGEVPVDKADLTLASAQNVSFVLLPNVSNLKTFLCGDKMIDALISRLVRDHDALIARLPSRVGALFVREAIQQGKPYAIEVVGCPWDAFWNYGGVKGKLFALYAKLELRDIAKQADFSLYVTESFLQTKYPPKSNAYTTFCSNVEIPYIDGEVLKNRFRKIESYSPDKPMVFGMVANYSSRYKGIDVAIQALKEANLSNWELRILGRGDDRFYKQLAEKLGVDDQVHFEGGLPSGEPVFKWLDAIDIYLHPSYQEGLPRALVEAMSRGVPALATNIAGIPELLRKSELVRAGDYKSLSQKVIRLSNDSSLQTLLAESNFIKAKSFHKNVLDERRSSFWNQFRDSLNI